MSSIEKSSKIVREVYNSRLMLLEQMKMGGYDVSEYEAFSINEVYHMVKTEQMDMLIKGDGKKMYVKYSINKILKPTAIQNVIEELFDYEGILDAKTDSILFITKSDPNDTLVKELEQLWNERHIYVNVVYIKRLQFNVLKHSLVPKHEVLTELEEEEFTTQYNIKDANTQIPTISRFDPVAIAIGLRPGQICRIHRKSPTSIKTVYYRVCV
jgi:DNA-directed RNA polymerase subunit H (RpoH/RPB5)